MKFRFISAHREIFKVGRMCKLLNVSRSGYHAVDSQFNLAGG